ncbi:MAG: hypothetical protein JXB88_05575 [Spirochaetales bacterium]|nr:hypothetical protein [Spirochaetales bacterium]
MNKVETVSGIITEIRQTNSTENGIPVYANTYTFHLDRQEKTYKDVSYTSGHIYEIEQEVAVEYLVKNPELSRIKGTRTAEFPPGFFYLYPFSH